MPSYKKPRPPETPERRQWREETTLSLMKTVQITAIKSAICMPVEDLIQEGAMALFDCLAMFDEARGLKPWTFAYQRVLGAMKDYARAHGRMTKGGERTGRVEHVASLEKVLLYDERSTKFGDTLIDEETDDPTDMLHSRWNEILRGFSDRERYIVIEYYVRDRTMKNIGESIGVHESFVSQTMKSIQQRLRKLEVSEQRVSSNMES